MIPIAKNRRKLGKCLVIIGLLFLACLAVYGIKPYTAESSNGSVMAKNAGKISPDIQFLPLIDVQLPHGIEKLTVWPSQEEIQKRFAKTDISKKLPPIFHERGGLKPVKEGGVSPQKAKRQSSRWVKEVLKPEWIPENIEDLMIPLRDEKPEKSIVVCRYKIGDISVQISQTRWAMSILLDVPKEMRTESMQEFAAAVFKKFFRQGEKMAALKGKLTVKEPSTAAPEKGVKTILRNLTGPQNLESVQSWWEWIAWTRKDSTMAVFLLKRVEGEQHTTTPDEPWF